jgi:serine/threonine protein kinase/tetratricopeptide (TPR) repeat protein
MAKTSQAGHPDPLGLESPEPGRGSAGTPVSAEAGAEAPSSERPQQRATRAADSKSTRRLDESAPVPAESAEEIQEVSEEELSPVPEGEAEAPAKAAAPVARPAPSAQPVEVSASSIDAESRATDAEASAGVLPLAELSDSAPPSIPSAAAASMDDVSRGGIPVLPGHVIAGRYDVLSVLGEGGMGIVYRCRERITGQLVAIKRVIPPPGNLANEYVMWFYKEARALAALEHPNIVRARDFGQLRDGSPYLAMDLVSGASLHDLTHSRLGFPVIWCVTDQILSALAHAHARGVIHGDLKPSNVLVEPHADEPPRVHVLDFGLAWLRLDAHDERLSGTKAMEFAPHAGAGTPGYMAPEQIQHEMHHVCGATDLYALGCILYRLFGGKAPFSGNSKELLRVHAFDAPPELKPVVDLPKGVTDFVMRLLAKRPWDRFEFAAEARALWGEWRPPSDPNAWQFQSPGRSAPPPRETPPTVPPPPNPDLAIAPDRPPGLLSIRPSPLVGRDEARQALRQVCDEVIDGEGPPHRLVLMVGPAGAGKSRIAEWLCEVVHEEGSMVPLRARYRAIRSPLDGMLGAALSYYNFERVDRSTIERSLLDRWRVRRDDKNGRTWVAGAAEWMRPLGPNQPVGPSGIRFTLDTLETRRMVIRYTLRKIGNGRPLLFWLDDLHNAGPATIEGLLRILNEEPDQRIVMLVTARSEEVALGTAAAERLRQLREAVNGNVIEIPALSPERTADLIRQSLPLEAAAVEEATRRSRGNPLFALQQLHAWALAGNMEFVDGSYRVSPEVLAMRPQTTAELWDSRLAAVPEPHRVAAFAAATLGGDVRRNVLYALLNSLGQPAENAMLSLQNAEVLLPRGPGRYSWPHELLQEHLLVRLGQRSDRGKLFRAAAAALTLHPLAGTRRIVRQRVVNLIEAGDSDTAALLLFEFLQNSWNGAREPLATLADLELLKGKLRGRTLALKNRWQAEALRHVGRIAEASTYAELARSRFEELEDAENIAHCQRLLGQLASEQGASAEGLDLVRRALSAFQSSGNVLGQALCESAAGEIEYLLGDYERARDTIQQAENNFAALDQPLGRGQCLLLLSWVEHSEGATARSRRLAQEARGEFERAGYRLGTAQADASLAHVEHRLLNYHSAEAGALEALTVFETLRTPLGQAACDRLLAMIGLDTDDADMAEFHAERAFKIYARTSDPWGLMETKLLFCQIALHRHDPARAEVLLEECSRLAVEETEPRQHFLLTRAWLQAERGDLELALESIEAAADVFGPRTRAGDHTPQLLTRMLRYRFSDHARSRIDAWRVMLNDRARRNQG